jgi:group I intron endonuclease
MGLIYCYKSPEGKEYIGQTKRSMIERDKDHIKDCKRLQGAFYKALKKYGRDKFELTILKVCDDHELNKYEQMFIKERNTMHPNGYNMRNGGSGLNVLCDESRKKLSDSVRSKNKDLPMHMTRIRMHGKLIGYAVHRHPKQPRQICFVNNHDPESMFEKAMECLTYLNNLKEDELDTRYVAKTVGGQRKISSNLPKYVNQTTNRNGDIDGYRVRTYKPNEPQKSFKFLQDAINYLNELIEKRMQLRD